MKDEFISFFADYKEEEVYERMADNKEFLLQFSELDKYDPDLVDEFEERPEEFLEAINQAAEEASEFNYPINYRIIVDVNHYDKPIYRARSGSNSGEPLTVVGTVESVANPYQEVDYGIYECSQCGERYKKEQSGDKKTSPYKCDCGSRNFSEKEIKHDDVLEAVLGRQDEENVRIEVAYRTSELEDRLKAAFRPGNKLRLTGILKIKERKKNSTKGDPYLDVVAYEEAEKTKNLEEFDDEMVEEVRQKVKHRTNPFEDFACSLAPEILENDKAKKVMSASLFGGASHRDDGRIHVAIFSNPGMGKSDIQKFVKETFPNSHYADQNSTGVGLTATVEQDEGGSWRLKAGKLVYADKGVLSVDEFDKNDSEQLSRLNTAMQNPTFPINKGGVNTELPGEATVIATGNFVDYYDSEESDYIQEYIPDKAESLMDRFSLVYCMVDEKDRSVIREGILDSFSSDPDMSVDPVFDEEELVIYRETAERCEPSLSQVSRQYLKDWLDAQESIGTSKGNDSVRKDSNRYLVSLAKLTTMFARSRLAERTNERDAENAIQLLVDCRSSRGLADGEPVRGDFNKKEKQKKRVRDAYERVKDESDDGVSVQRIIDEADCSEDDVEQVVERMKSEGELFEPKPGYVEEV